MSLRLFAFALAVAAVASSIAAVSAECPYKKMMQENGAADGGGGDCGSGGSSCPYKGLPGPPVINMPAPTFAPTTAVMPDGSFKKVSLADYKGKWTVLFFYPRAYTFVCPTEILGFSDAASELAKHNTVILGCNVEGHHATLAWTKAPVSSGGLGGPVLFPIISDMTKTIARSYRVLIEHGEDAGVALRGTFIIDPKGMLRHYTVNDLPVSRNVDDIIRLVRGYQHADAHGEVCPHKWKPGGRTMKPDPEGSLEYFAELAKERGN